MNVDSMNILKRCSSAPTIKITTASTSTQVSMTSTTSNTNIIPTAPRSRDASPTPTMNIFAPRVRRYSTGFSPLATNPGPLPRLTPRVSQLRQEECVDLASREANHEREVRTAIQISQSWEDLTLDAENWSFKNDTELSNPLHVTLPTNIISCSSPSPTSSRAGLRLPYVLSPSPTRRTFATRRSMSPIAMRPSSLGPVKRRFDTDDNYTNMYSPPSKRKLPSETGLSPCPSPLLTICPSPDSSDDRTTPKFYISKLYTNNSSSLSSSPTTAPSPSLQSTLEMQLDLPNVNSCGSSSSSSCSSSLNKPSFEMYDVPIESDCVDGGDSNANDGENNLKIHQIDKINKSIQANSNRTKFSAIDGNDNGVKSYDDINELGIDNNETEKTNNMKFMIAASEKNHEDGNKIKE